MRDYGILSSRLAVTQNGLKAADQAPDPSHFHFCQRVSLKCPGPVSPIVAVSRFNGTDPAGPGPCPSRHQPTDGSVYIYLFLMKDTMMKGNGWLLLKLGHSVPLRVLMDSLL